MDAFKRLSALVAMAAMAGLSGCTVPVESDRPGGDIPPGHAGSGPNEDGQSCSVGRSGAVYILVGYDASGMPMISPERCHVVPGTKVTWRGPDHDRTSFVIEFKAASASVNGERRVASEVGRERSKARIVAGRVGSYAYSVKANGRELDPQIIIDPQ